MRQWHKAVARSMYLSDSEDDHVHVAEKDPILAHVMPKYRGGPNDKSTPQPSN